MSMEKKKLNESGSALVAILVLGVSYWILKKIGTYSICSIFRNRAGCY